MHDLVFKSATVYDGSGAEPTTADVAIDGERISDIGTASGATEIDSSGLALAPGFIDVHTHDDFAAVIYPDMGFKVRGGVTTCIVGNCGMGAAPYRQASTMARAFHPGQTLPDWGDYAGYAQTLQTHGIAINIGILVGHGTMRMAAMGAERGVPDDAQMAAMKAILNEGLDAGALGMSTGLIYEPGRHAATDEIVELAAEMRGVGGIYATHMRDEGTGLLASIEETIQIGERAGVAVQISHHKASGRDAWGTVGESLALIERAQATGLDIHADQYPYTAGSTILSAVLQPDTSASRGVVYEDIVIASTESHPEWEGQSLAALSLTLALTPHETGQFVLREEPLVTVILHSMNEDDVQTVMRHASTMIGSDGIPTLSGKPHPRLYGTFARVLGHYARDLGLFRLEEAVYRMTGFPAAKFGLEDRGVIAPGAFADLVLFDPSGIVDVGTFEDPNHSPKGIRQVLVNGEVVVAAGTHTESRTGKVLRRAG